YFSNNAISKNAALEIKKYFNKKYVCADLAHIELILNGGNNVKNPLCRAMSSNIVISPDNQLMLPCFHRCFKKIKIDNNLYKIYKSKEAAELRKQEGKFGFCNGCAIYCYMKTSMYRKVFSKYFYLSLKTGYKFLRERARKQF
ncbi:MAG: radical SAM protein, partial [Nanoarchaeota archaeon]|nr:radical SAM protein [Nanoarchaeota archaeon]